MDLRKVKMDLRKGGNSLSQGIEERIDEWINGFMDGWMDGCTKRRKFAEWRDWGTNWWMNKWIHSWLNGWMFEWTDEWMDGSFQQLAYVYPFYLSCMLTATSAQSNGLRQTTTPNLSHKPLHMSHGDTMNNTSQVERMGYWMNGCTNCWMDGWRDAWPLTAVLDEDDGGGEGNVFIFNNDYGLCSQCMHIPSHARRVPGGPRYNLSKNSRPLDDFSQWLSSASVTCISYFLQFP